MGEPILATTWRCLCVVAQLATEARAAGRLTLWRRSTCSCPRDREWVTGCGKVGLLYPADAT